MIIIQLDKDIMVLNNVTKFHKILIKLFNVESGRHWDRRTYIKYGRTWVTLNAPAIVTAREMCCDFTFALSLLPEVGGGVICIYSCTEMIVGSVVVFGLQVSMFFIL